MKFDEEAACKGAVVAVGTGVGFLAGSLISGGNPVGGIAGAAAGAYVSAGWAEDVCDQMKESKGYLPPKNNQPASE